MAKDDPNVANEQGHTYYPKYVKNTEGKVVIVQNKKEEADAVGHKATEEKTFDAKASKAEEKAWSKN